MATTDRRAEREAKEAKAIMVLVLLAVMLFGVSSALEWHSDLAGLDAFSEMAQMLFKDYIVSFEILGFLLLAALIGSLYLANKEAVRRG